MKKEFLTFLIFGLGVASTLPVDAQQRAGQNRRLPQTRPAVSAAVPASDAASTDAPAPSARPAARPEG
ncbi:MAG: hypothetical protein IKU86_02290, partial [Thermoguttaceae bacterium]|nr:hypothetical protein [Thermoguttaceae bacterium]